jgi:hypothetical protein
MSDQHDSNVTEQPRYLWATRTTSATSTCRPACSTAPASPASRQHQGDARSADAPYFQADSTVYAKAGGDHQFKFGVQADRSATTC